jgi:hypothetical protein
MAGNTAYHKQNLAWPLAWYGSRIKVARLIERLESGLHHLVMTPKGSFWFDLNYGTNAYLLRTQGMDGGRIAAVLADIRLGAANYLPDAIVHNLTSQITEDEHKLQLGVIWGVRGANTQLHGELGVQRKLSVII